MARYTVRLSNVPGRLAVCVPLGRGVIEGQCVVCQRSMADTVTDHEHDGLVSHGMHAGACAAAYRRSLGLTSAA